MKKINASDLINLDDKFMLEVAEKLLKLQSDKDSSKTHLSTTEVANLLNVSRYTVVRYIQSYFSPDKYINTPKLKAVKSGKSWLINKSDLGCYLLNPKNPKYN